LSSSDEVEDEVSLVVMGVTVVGHGVIEVKVTVASMTVIVVL
jgi:hypothetical protein